MDGPSPVQEHPGRRTRAPRPGLWGLGIAGLALAWAVFSWGWIWSLVSGVLERHDSTFAEVYRLHEPGFANGFREGLPSGVGELVRNGGYGSWWVAFAILVVLTYWWLSAARIRGTGLAAGHLLAALAPSLAGLAYFPWGVMEVSTALAEAGISAPVLIGLGLGEATSPFIFGTLASVSLLIGVFVWKAKARS